MISAMRCSFFRMSAASCRRRQMGDVFFAARILAVEVAAIRQQFGGGDLPARSFLFAFFPPCHQWREFLELDRCGLCVVLPAFGQRLLVIPDILRRAGAVEEKDVRGDAGVGREDAVGQAHDGVEIEILEQFFLDASADAIAEECAVWHDDGGACRASAARASSLRMMSWRNSSAVSAVCLSSGNLPWMPRSSSPPNGGLVRIMSTRSFSPISVSLKASELPGLICGDSRPCSNRFIWRAGRAAVWLQPPKMLRRCKRLSVLDGLASVAEMLERLRREIRQCRRLDRARFAKPRIGDGDHEPHDGPRRVEFAGIAGGIAHLAQHGFVESAQSMEFLSGCEMDASNFVDDVAQQIAALHAVDRRP